jgi:hypothetical protein
MLRLEWSRGSYCNCSRLYCPDAPLLVFSHFSSEIVCRRGKTPGCVFFCIESSNTMQFVSV